MVRTATAVRDPQTESTQASVSLADRRTLERSLIYGMAWTGGAKWLAQILSWASTLMVARLLTPADYGIVGMAMVYFGLVQVVNEFGIGSAVVQQRDLTAPDLAQISGFSVGLGCVWFLLSLAAAAPIAAFFGEPAVRAVIIVLGLTFVAAGFRTMPIALMTRDFRFRRLAGLDGLEALVLAGVTLTGAIAGLGYWALVSGVVTSRVAGAVAAQVLQPQRIALPLHLTQVTRTLLIGFHVLRVSCRLVCSQQRRLCDRGPSSRQGIVGRLQHRMDDRQHSRHTRSRTVSARDACGIFGRTRQPKRAEPVHATPH